MDHSMHHDSSATSANPHAGHDMGSMCSMNMIFTWDSTDLCVVFDWWHVRNTFDLVLTLIAIACLSAGYEYLRYRIRIIDAEIANNADVVPTAFSRNTKIKQALGYALQVGYSYLLMLVFMTYNGWAMLSVCAGAGLGFYMWGDKAQRSMSCH